MDRKTNNISKLKSHRQHLQLVNKHQNTNVWEQSSLKSPAWYHIWEESSWERQGNKGGPKYIVFWFLLGSEEVIWTWYFIAWGWGARTKKLHGMEAA